MLIDISIRDLNDAVKERHLNPDIDAESFTVNDVAGYFTATTIEAVLAEIYSELNTIGIWSLTSDEVTQLQNIDTTTISTTQWGYLGELNQSLTSTSTPSFNSITLNNTGTNNSDAVRYDQLASFAAGLDWQKSVISFWDASIALPVGPSTGDRYICSVTGNGWTIHYIYEYNGATWDEIISNEGFTCWVEDVDTNYTFNGTIWVEFGSTISHNNTTGLQGGTSGQYNHTTNVQHTVITQAATTSLDGYLSSTDWTTFNAKAPTASPTFTGNIALDGITNVDNDFYVSADGGTTQAIKTTVGTLTATQTYYQDETASEVNNWIRNIDTSAGGLHAHIFQIKGQEKVRINANGIVMNNEVISVTGTGRIETPQIKLAGSYISATAIEINTVADGTTAKNSHTHPYVDGAGAVAAVEAAGLSMGADIGLNDFDINSVKNITFNNQDTGGDPYFSCNSSQQILNLTGDFRLNTGGIYMNGGGIGRSNTLTLQFPSSGDVEVGNSANLTILTDGEFTTGTGAVSLNGNTKITTSGDSPITIYRPDDTYGIESIIKFNFQNDLAQEVTYAEMIVEAEVTMNPFEDGAITFKPRINNVPTEMLKINFSGVKIGTGAAVDKVNTTFVDNDTSLMTSAAINNLLSGAYTDADAVAAVNAAGLSLATTKVYNSVNQDAKHYFGRSVVGYDGTNSDIAHFGHRSDTVRSGFHALSDGSSYINFQDTYGFSLKSAEFTICSWTGSGLTMANSKDITMSGDATFTTGAGAISLNGDTTIATGKVLDADWISHGFHILGNNTLAANESYFGFYESDKSTSDGYVGIASPTSYDIYLGSYNGNVVMSPSGGTSATFSTAGLTLASSRTFKFATGATVGVINTTFVDNDTSLMTSAAIDNQIGSKSYVTGAGAVSAVNAAGLSLATTKVYSSLNESAKHLFGRCAVGDDATMGGTAGFGHRSHHTNASCGFKQTSDGQTVVNAPTGKKIYFLINASTNCELDVNGFTLRSGKTLSFTDGGSVNRINTTFVDNDTSLMTSAAIDNRCVPKAVKHKVINGHGSHSGWVHGSGRSANIGTSATPFYFYLNHMHEGQTIDQFYFYIITDGSVSGNVYLRSCQLNDNTPNTQYSQSITDVTTAEYITFNHADLTVVDLYEYQYYISLTRTGGTYAYLYNPRLTFTDY